MNKEDFLQNRVEQVLHKIDFINRYILLSTTHSERDDSFIIKNDQVVQIANDFGCPLKYSKTKEFHWQEDADGYTFKFGFSIRFNSFDFGLSIINEQLGIKTSAPWGLLVQLMSEGQQKVNKVGFRNYEEINVILKDFLSICKDMKKGLIESQA